MNGATPCTCIRGTDLDIVDQSGDLLTTVIGKTQVRDPNCPATEIHERTGR